MKKLFPFMIVGALFFITGYIANGKQQPQQGYVIVHENEVKEQQTGPHEGGGSTTVFNLFSGKEGSGLAFRKRVLHPGSSIGYHLQKEEEIYYLLSGRGELNMNGKLIPVAAGDAILTKAGNSHGLKPTGNEDLILIINYSLER